METDPEMANMIYSLDKDAKALTIKILQRQEEKRFKRRTKCTLVICYNMKGPWRHDSKCDRTDTEGLPPHDTIYKGI